MPFAESPAEAPSVVCQWPWRLALLAPSRPVETTWFGLQDGAHDIESATHWQTKI